MLPTLLCNLIGIEYMVRPFKQIYFPFLIPERLEVQLSKMGP